MDGYSSYNQVNMAVEDIEKTTLITPWRTYCYTMMPLGLKNIGATYQRTTITFLHDLMHKGAEAYVDDMIIKSKQRDGHVLTLQ